MCITTIGGATSMHLICFFLFCHAADVTQPSGLPEPQRAVAQEKQPLPTEEVSKMLKWLVKISSGRNRPTSFHFLCLPHTAAAP